MSCVKFAIMPSNSGTKDLTQRPHPSHMSHSHSRPKPRGPPLHQNTWPLMTNMSSIPGPPSANLFSPSQAMQNVRNVSEIIPGLYISDLAFAENPPSLMSYRITHVLSTLPDKIFCPPPTLLPLQPHRLQIRIEDLPFAELASHLPSTTAWIRDALAHPEARVLVHCVEGISRSVTVVAAFLMAQYKWSPSQALQYIKSKRRIAEPNFGFVQQLHEYGKDQLGMVLPAPVLPTFNPTYPQYPNGMGS